MKSRRFGSPADTTHSITSSALASRDGGTLEAEHPGGSGLMTNSNFWRLLDRQVRRFRPFEDPAGIDSDLPPDVHKSRSVAHQPAGLDILSSQ